MTFRWYGKNDPVQIKYIRQIPNMHGIVSAVYDVPVGERWSEESVKAVKASADEVGLAFEVVESVPVHEDIKLGKPTRDKLIDNYNANIRLLAKHGVKCICYNFMPVFDWTRTSVNKVNADQSTCLDYRADILRGLDPLTSDISLPGWDASYKKSELAEIFSAYGKINKEKLWENLEYFLKKVIPVAKECDVKMAIHPDDPPWDIFGLPRLICDEKSIDRFLKIVDSPYNGLTFCTGSLGCAHFNDVVKMVDKYAKMGRIHFIHIRNVKLLDKDGSFEETAHYSPCGSLDVAAIVNALHKNKFTGYVRPDHGRMIWGETGRPGYGLYDRALGAMYIGGLWEALEKYTK